ncbi:hypothetical protein HGRIS_009435 [Hohenbuehelia grisea]
MDPVQRIPRYTLMFREMIKYMAENDPQRAKLVEAVDIASKIAQADPDEPTKRAAIMYCLSTSIEGFPADLFSHSRRFIDCIDVEDIVGDTLPSGSSSNISTSATSLHCSLFLFDDKIMIVKRPNGEKGGKALTGLDKLDKVTKAGGLPSSKKKSGMVCKGVVDVTDVAAVDVGGADIHLYLESPPQDQGDRWSGRPFRSLAVVNPPMPINLDPTQTEEEKNRFLESLWRVQARYRARAGQSVVLCAEEREVESHGGRITMARTYFNVYQRTAFLQEKQKTKVVVHIDPLGYADPIPFGIGGPPHVVIRIQPMAGELSRYTVTSNDPRDESEEDIVQTARVPSRIIQTIHQYGLFKFRTGKTSAPSTPSASMRSRAALFGLDVISRNLFNSRPGSAMGDFFGGSINGHRRTKSTTSRTSSCTQSASTIDSTMKFSYRSRSTTTAATTISSMNDDDSYYAPKPVSKQRKLFKRSKSPGGTSIMQSPGTSPSRSSALARSRSPSMERDSEYSDYETEDDAGVQQGRDASEMEITMRLALARKNSRNQSGKQPSGGLERPVEVEETIYEEEPPLPIRPASRASRESHMTRSSETATPDNPYYRPASRASRDSHATTLRSSDTAVPEPTTPRHSRSTSQHSADRRPLGPRSPSPMLMPSSPEAGPSRQLMRTPEPEPMLTLSRAPSEPRNEVPKSGIPRSKRQPLFPLGNGGDTTPKPQAEAVPLAVGSVEPLSIKKKTSVRSATAAAPSTPTWKASSRSSPLSRSKLVSARRVSPSVARHMSAVSGPSHTHASTKHDDADSLLHLAQATKEDVDSSYRAVKRIKLSVQELKDVPARVEDISRPGSPEKGLRTPQRANAAMTRAAQERMEEMRRMIGRRQDDLSVSTRVFPTTPIARAQSPAPSSPIKPATSAIDSLVEDAAAGLEKASTSATALQTKLKQVVSQLKEGARDLQQARSDLQSSKRQCELVKSLLDDATAEKDIMYDAFNEELDGMYNDANLPGDEAWAAMTDNLRQTKEARNSLAKENSQLKRKLAELESEHEEWGAMLRAHGLIS